jgi:hypothetical protein
LVKQTGVAGLSRFAFPPACFFPVFSGELKPGLPTPGAEGSSLVGVDYAATLATAAKNGFGDLFTSIRIPQSCHSLSRFLSFSAWHHKFRIIANIEGNILPGSLRGTKPVFKKTKSRGRGRTAGTGGKKGGAANSPRLDGGIGRCGDGGQNLERWQSIKGVLPREEPEQLEVHCRFRILRYFSHPWTFSFFGFMFCLEETKEQSRDFRRDCYTKLLS